MSEDRHEPPVPPHTSKRRSIRGVLVAALLIGLAFLAGFVWQNVEARSARAERDDLRRRLALEEMSTTLATAVLQVDAGSYENGRTLASRFFTGLQDFVNDAGPGAGESDEALRAILRQRDAVITALSRNEPIGEEMLTRLFVRYRVATGGLEEGIPVPAGSPGAETPADTGAADSAGTAPEAPATPPGAEPDTTGR